MDRIPQMDQINKFIQGKNRKAARIRPFLLTVDH